MALIRDSITLLKSSLVFPSAPFNLLSSLYLVISSCFSFFFFLFLSSFLNFFLNKFLLHPFCLSFLLSCLLLQFLLRSFHVSSYSSVLIPLFLLSFYQFSIFPLLQHLISLFFPSISWLVFLMCIPSPFLHSFFAEFFSFQTFGPSVVPSVYSITTESTWSG